MKKIIQNKFLKNTSWILFAQIYQMILQLIIGVISARFLGPANYGVISYGASYISFFAIIASLGLEGVVVKEIVSKRDMENTILGSSIFMRMIAGIFSMFFVIVIVKILNPKDTLLISVTLLQSIVLFFNAFNIIDTWYQSHLRSKISTLIRCTSYTILAAYKITLLVLRMSVEWFAFSTSLDSILIAIMFVISYKNHGGKRFRIDGIVIKNLFSMSFNLVISYLMAVVYSQMDRIMIGRMIDQTHVGYYTAAVTICSMWVFIPQAISNSARPIIMELKNINTVLYLERIKQLTSAIIWIGVIFSVLISIFSGFIINMLYGEKYLNAQLPLMLVIWSTVFSSLSYPRSIWMICENKQHYTKNIMFWGVVMNLVLNVLLIPKIGISGAALATLLTEVVTCLIAPLFYKETRIFVKYLFESVSLNNLLQLIIK